MKKKNKFLKKKNSNKINNAIIFLNFLNFFYFFNLNFFNILKHFRNYYFFFFNNVKYKKYNISTYVYANFKNILFLYLFFFYKKLLYNLILTINTKNK